RNHYNILLLAQLFQQVSQLNYKPPVTIALIAANLWIYFTGVDGGATYVGLSLWECCLQPRLVLKGQWRRLVLSAFLHVDETHVLYNMSSLLWKGVRLERRYGSLRFAALVGELLLAAHGMTVLLAAVLAAQVPGYWYLMESCAVGFSAVLFALKVVLSHDDPGYEQVMGFWLPTKYMCWAELLLISYLSPRVSFLGHLGGILAGLLHVRLLAPGARRAAQVLRRSLRYLGLHPSTDRQPFFRSRGRLGAAAATTTAPAAPAAPTARGSDSGGSTAAGRPIPVWGPERPPASRMGPQAGSRTAATALQQQQQRDAAGSRSAAMASGPAGGRGMSQEAVQAGAGGVAAAAGGGGAAGTAAAGGGVGGRRAPPQPAAAAHEESAGRGAGAGVAAPEPSHGGATVPGAGQQQQQQQPTVEELRRLRLARFDGGGGI
ncbi:hypothetical protein Agub_g1526, partial [Astrephomene gubernaculifera]